MLKGVNPEKCCHYISMASSNRGTGAGGFNTNLHGKRFEDKTDNVSHLLNEGFTPVILSKKPTLKTIRLFSKKYCFCLTKGVECLHETQI
jgi:hypothetical protein